MKREIFIIHSSGIVRKGLSAILKGAPGADITQLDGFAGLAPFSELSGSRILVISPCDASDEVDMITRLKRRNTVHHICISLDRHQEMPVGSARHVLTLESGEEEWKELVTRLFDPGDQKDERGLTDSELTARERDVLQHVALGHSNKEIADKLFISIHTVISHRKNITEKLGIKSISGLTVYAILNRIIDPERINPDQLI